MKEPLWEQIAIVAISPLPLIFAAIYMAYQAQQQKGREH